MRGEREGEGRREGGERDRERRERNEEVLLTPSIATTGSVITCAYAPIREDVFTQSHKKTKNTYSLIHTQKYTYSPMHTHTSLQTRIAREALFSCTVALIRSLRLPLDLREREGGRGEQEQSIPLLPDSPPSVRRCACVGV
jgi:hypothetical protein